MPHLCYCVADNQLDVDGTTQAVSGKLLLQASRYPEYHYGDALRATGRLQTPPCLDDFCYRDYLARQGMHSLIKTPKSVELIAHGLGSHFWAALTAFRHHASGTINGILLGIESGIPRDLYDDFNATGTSHIIVISGFNLQQCACVRYVKGGPPRAVACAMRRRSRCSGTSSSDLSPGTRRGVLAPRARCQWTAARTDSRRPANPLRFEPDEDSVERTSHTRRNMPAPSQQQ